MTALSQPGIVPAPTAAPSSTTKTNLGMFITMDGPEGGGKTTQVPLLGAALEAKGLPVTLTREAGGGSSAAKAIRELLISDQEFDPLTEVLLYNAARRENVHKCVRPALQAGRWVVCDRYVDTTRAYQGYAMGVDQKQIRDLHALSTGGLWPGLSIVLDVPVELSLERARSRGAMDRYERMDRNFHERLRQGHLEIAAASPGRCVVIDASGTVPEVHAAILEAVETRLQRFLPPSAAQ